MLLSSRGINEMHDLAGLEGNQWKELVQASFKQTL